MSERELLFVKPCWGVFREHDRRTLSTYSSADAAVQGALTRDNVDVVVLDEDGKVVGSITQTRERT